MTEPYFNPLVYHDIVGFSFEGHKKIIITNDLPKIIKKQKGLDIRSFVTRKEARLKAILSYASGEDEIGEMFAQLADGPTILAIDKETNRMEYCLFGDGLCKDYNNFYGR